MLIVMYVPFSVFCVLFVCNGVLYYCQRVSTQLQLHIYHIIPLELKYIKIKQYDIIRASRDGNCRLSKLASETSCLRVIARDCTK
jgi:hypothetical protein